MYLEDLCGSVEGEIRDLRTEMREEFRDVRGEMRSGFASVNARIDSLHAMMFRLSVAIMVGMAGLIATLIGSIAAGAL